MASTWKTVRVFISSTFRDMHAERDHLVKVVFPALRERLEKHRVYLDDIDLRWGVTREQAESDRILDLCLKQIKECRPFFIGILGERYGTATGFSEDALRTFPWIQEYGGRSITELEILHGVLRAPSLCERAFFYFRNPKALDDVPEPIRQQTYAETDPELQTKLADLKARIKASGRPVMDPYTPHWDPEAYDRPGRSKGRLVGLDDFGERVREQVWQAIQAEYQLPVQPPVEVTASAALTIAEEKDYHDRFMESRLRVYAGREQINDALLAFADGNDLFPCLVTGPSGSGKSAVMARFVRDYQHKQPATLVLPHFIGASPHSTILRDMLRRFCQVLKGRFGFAEEVPEEVAKLSVTFREFVSKVPADTRVLLAIDALNQLDEADRAQELYWLPTELPPQVRVIVSCITDSGKTEPVLEAFRWRKHCLVQLAALSDAEQRDIICQVPSLSAKTLDDDQVRLLLSNPATANPLFLLVALEELRGFAPYERLNERMAAFPREGDTVTAVFTQVIERLAEEFNQELVETVLSLLASARRGLSERELQELVAGLDGADDLFPVLRQLRPYLLSRAGLIDFYHRNLFKAVRERFLPSEEQRRQAHVRLAEYFNAQDYWLESLEGQRRRAKTLPPTPRPANVRKVDELPWQLLQAADWPRSEQLLTDLPFLEAKAEAGMVFDLAADFNAVIAGMPADRRLLRNLRLLEEALRRDMQFIARHPTTLFQALWNSCWWYDCQDVEEHFVPPEPLLTKVPSAGAAVAPTEWLKHLWNRIRQNRTTAVPRRRGDASRLFTDPFSAGRRGTELCDLLDRWLSAQRTSAVDFPWLRSSRPPIVQLGGIQRSVLSNHVDHVTCVTYSPDGRMIASGSYDSTVRLWDVASGTEMYCMRGHQDAVNTVAFSSDGRLLVSGSGRSYHNAEAQDTTIRVWDVLSGKPLLCLCGHAKAVSSVEFTTSGRRVISGSADGTVRVWDVDGGKEISRSSRTGNLATKSVISANGRYIVTAGIRSATLRLCHSGKEELLYLPAHEGGARETLYDPVRKRVVTNIHLWTVRVWDVETGDEKHCLRGHDDLVRSVAYSPDGKRIASASDDCSIRVWDTESGAELCRLLGHEKSVQSVVFSPCGRWIASGSADNTIRVWRSECSGTTPILKQHVDRVTSVRYFSDGNRVITGSGDNTVRVWDSMQGILLHCLVGHEASVSCLACSHDARMIASGSHDCTVRLWDASAGRQLHCLYGHSRLVNCLAFSPDDSRLVSAATAEARVWDARAGKELLRLEGHERSVTVAFYSANGRRIVTGGALDKNWRIWDAGTGKCLMVVPAERGLIPAVLAEERLCHWSARKTSLETVLEQAETGRPIAWFCVPLDILDTHPLGRGLAGAREDQFHIISLERHEESSLPRITRMQQSAIELAGVSFIDMNTLSLSERDRLQFGYSYQEFSEI